MNWGYEYHHFFKVVLELAAGGVDITFRMPRFFSETRFPNYSYQVFSGFLENFQAIVILLTEVQEAGLQDEASAHAKDKADKAAGFQAQILNGRFMLQLALITDVYLHYGRSVDVLQIVNIFPHEKFDRFQSGCLATYEKMETTADLVKCVCRGQAVLNELQEDVVGGAEDTLQQPEDVVNGVEETLEQSEVVVGGAEETQEQPDKDLMEGEQVQKEQETVKESTSEEKCLWPNLHKCIKEVRNEKQFRGVPIPNLEPDPLRPGTRQGSEMLSQDKNQRTDLLVKNICDIAKSLVKYLHDGLEKIYTEEDIKKIKNIREVLDLKSLMDKVIQHGAKGVYLWSLVNFFL